MLAQGFGREKAQKPHTFCRRKAASVYRSFGNIRQFIVCIGLIPMSLISSVKATSPLSVRQEERQHERGE